MIVLTVLSYSGVPAEGLSARFEEMGGSIGRADTNQLVLPDPERSISRLHARVVFRSGQYAIVDNGSNPIGVNGAAVPAGREQIIRPGDQVQIGSYLLAVSQAAASGASADPFADLFGGGASGLAGPVSAPAPASAWTSPPMVSPRPAAAAMPPMRAGATPAPAQARPGSALLADNWDFLAPAPATTASASPAAAGWPAPTAGDLAGLGLSMGPGAVDSLDALFGLGNAPAGGDPLGAAPAQALLLQPNMAGHADPLQALGRPAPDPGASWADLGSDLHTPMPLPKPVAATPAPAPAPAAWPAAASTAPMATAAPASLGLPSGAIFSWDDPPRDGRVVTLPGAARVDHPGQAA